MLFIIDHIIPHWGKWAISEDAQMYNFQYIEGLISCGGTGTFEERGETSREAWGLEGLSGRPNLDNGIEVSKTCLEGSMFQIIINWINKIAINNLQPAKMFLTPSEINFCLPQGLGKHSIGG